MLIRKILKISAIGASFFILSACSTGKDDLGEGNLNGGQISDKATVSGTGDLSSFDSDENVNALKVGNQTYYFDFDKSTIHDNDIPSLQVQARYLIAHPEAKILIAGNTDERGSREYNIGLGQRRALSVTQFLRSQGVNKNQILTVSYGAEKPIAFGHSEADYSKNRRADLQYQSAIITNKG
ncbi:MAG: peptidoglycan-associated lipoprotein Pal [Rickettsiella sp.]|nr:peptidoglycan-associated lipoprotein Pal [Rickettsiella sp.]